MPKLSIEIVQTENHPVKKLLKDGITEKRKMEFSATHKNLDFKLTVNGPKKVIHDIFGNWPLEVGNSIQLALNSKLAQNTLKIPVKPTAVNNDSTAEADSLAALEQEINDM